MKSYRNLALALVVVVAGLVGLVVATGGDDEDSSTAAPTTSTSSETPTTVASDESTTTVAAPAPEPVETTIPGPPTRTSQTLEVGDCFSRAPDEEVTEFRLVPCDQPHTDEVYTVITMRQRPGTRYPRNLDDLAEDGCYNAFVTFMGVEPEESDYAYDWYTPTEAEWAAGARRVPCVVTDPDGKPVTGSAADARD